MLRRYIFYSCSRAGTGTSLKFDSIFFINITVLIFDYMNLMTNAILIYLYK